MRLAVLVLLISAASLGAAETYYGKVVGITDGDTLTLLTDKKRQIKVRLAEIDTPERGQPWGTRAKQALSDLAFGKEARVVYVDTDRYGRMAGRVYVGDTDVNAELIKGGHAWVYRQYVTDPSLFALEEQAKANGRGLWGLPEAQVQPWEWRRGRRQPVCREGGDYSRQRHPLRHQAILQGDGLLRGGAALPQELRIEATGRGQ